MASESHFQNFKRILLEDQERVEEGSKSEPLPPRPLPSEIVASAHLQAIRVHIREVILPSRPLTPPRIDRVEELRPENDRLHFQFDEPARRSRSGTVVPAQNEEHCFKAEQVIATENDGLKNFFKGLYSRINIRNPWDSPNASAPVEPGKLAIDVWLVETLRCEIQSELSAMDTSEDLRQDLGNILSCVTRKKESQMENAAISLEGLEAGKVKEGVGFKQLPYVFLPGKLVYVANSDLTSDGGLGQCWRVNRCEFVQSTTKFIRSEPTRRQYLRIRTLKWEWSSADLDFCLVSGILKVEEYDGRVPLDELGVIPMTMMESATETDIRRRLIFRGKLYRDLFFSTRSLWGYHGPATRHAPPLKRFNPRVGTKSGNENEGAAMTVWRPMIKTRAIVSIFIPQRSPYEISTPYTLDFSEPMNDETYMVFSSCLWVQPVTSLSGPSLMVHLDHLSPVIWNETSLSNSGEKIGAQVLSILRTFQPLDKAQARLEGRPAGQIMIVHGDMIKAISIMAAVAEHDKRALLEIDLLDLIRNTRNVRNEDGLFRVLQGRLNLATRLRGVVLLQNFAPFVARRSLSEWKRCEEITTFIEMLETYSEIIVLCLEKGDTIDGKLRKLGPVYVNIDDDPAE